MHRASSYASSAANESSSWSKLCEEALQLVPAVGPSADLEKLDRMVDELKRCDGFDTASTLPLLSALSRSLILPAELVADDFEERHDRALLELQWRSYGTSALDMLHALLQPSFSRPASDLPLQQQLFVACARFVGEDLDPWTSTSSQHFAKACLALLTQSTSSASLIQRILADYLRPLFARRSHAHVNPESGRKLERPRGGPQQSNFSSTQLWKGVAEGSTGCWNVLQTCIEALKLDELERMWHLLIPPLMSLLDDHEIPYRIRGIQCLMPLLDRIDRSLLRRTGLDKLVQQSLTTSLSFLSFPEHAPLIALALPADLALIEKLYPRSPELSHDRFNALCRLMREGPLGIWTFASEKPAFALICVQFLPRLFEALGITSVRFLDTMIPPLAHLLRFPALSSELHVGAASAMAALLRCCIGSGQLLRRWRGTILAAVAMCWDQLDETRGASVGPSLRGVVAAMQEACPEEVKVDLERIDKVMSGSLRPLFAFA